MSGKFKEINSLIDMSRTCQGKFASSLQCGEISGISDPFH